ncbi:MAG: methyl-accepting chemotaxis protein [Halopseudomonas sp.]
MIIRLSIKRMLQLTICLTILGLVTLLLATNKQLSHTRMGIEKEEQQVAAILALKDSRYYVVQIQQFLTDVGATRSDEAKSEAASSLEGANQSLDELAKIAPELAARASTLKQQIAEAHRLGINMADAYLTEGTEAGNQLMKGAGGFDDASATLAESLDQLAQELDQQLEQAVVHTLSSTTQAGQVVLWSSLSIGVLLVGVMTILYRRTLTPLAQLEQSMRNIATGSKDLTAKLDDSGNDEIARVSNSFNLFVANIRSLISHINQETQRLGTTSQQLTSASQQTLGGMQRLELETDQVAAAINQMQATVLEVASNAELAADAAKDSDTQAKQGEEVVQQTISSISTLAEGVEQAAQVLQKLEGDTDNIGTILDVIRGIADQTNLLALNAAIEAARAGEQGRGFAVVADEVRTLAQRTQESTDQIQQMIGQLQSGAKNAVTAMQQSSSQAVNSTAQAAQAGAALSQITESVATISSMTTQIATAAEQQSAVAEDINRNIVNISDEARMTVANADQSNVASSEVNTLSQRLEQQVNQFKID